jgi:uncharacterized membrane protein
VYLTAWHWMTIFFFFALFVTLVIVSSREKKQKIFLSLVFASFLVTATAGVFSVFVLEKYTKKVSLEKISHKRIVRNDTIRFSGRIKNTGKYPVKKVILEIKIVNNAMQSTKLKGATLYKPSGFGEISSKGGDRKVTQILEKRVVATNLNPGISRSFSVTFDYPPYFQKPYLNHKVYAH